MKAYSFKYFITICHSGDNRYEHKHFHTLEVLLEVTDLDGRFGKFEQFGSIERYGDMYLKQYENIYLNDLPEFPRDARIETIGDVFFEGLEQVLTPNGLRLERLEVGDSPLHTYVLTRKI
ncbi:MAG: 6-carboxytetrahydropterin synthase [Lachnospiraceae bacterium]|nr:6-carboxytetrahydropterin synthase [Lachnospiraceae bacterium]